MKVRYFIDESTRQPHIYRHDVEEQEIEDVLTRPMEDRAGRDGSRVALGPNGSGPVLAGHLRPRSGTGCRLRDYGVRTRCEGPQGLASSSEVINAEEAMKNTTKQNQFPVGWNAARVKRVITHYEQQTDVAAVAEDEVAYRSTKATLMKVPVKLVPEVRALLAKRRAS